MAHVALSSDAPPPADKPGSSAPHAPPAGSESDEGGFIARLVRAHRQRLARVAVLEGAPADDAFDCVQEALCAFVALPGSRGLDDEAAGRVLSAMVRNLARNLRRSHAVSRPHDPEALSAIEAPGPLAEALLGQAEERVRLVGCVGRLGRMQRAVVTLRMLEELPGDSVARTLGLTTGHVAVLLHRAKHELRRCMDELDTDADSLGNHRTAQRSRSR